MTKKLVPEALAPEILKMKTNLAVMFRGEQLEVCTQAMLESLLVIICATNPTIEQARLSLADMTRILGDALEESFDHPDSQANRGRRRPN